MRLAEEKCSLLYALARSLNLDTRLSLVVPERARATWARDSVDSYQRSRGCARVNEDVLARSFG